MAALTARGALTQHLCDIVAGRSHLAVGELIGHGGGSGGGRRRDGVGVLAAAGVKLTGLGHDVLLAALVAARGVCDVSVGCAAVGVTGAIAAGPCQRYGVAGVGRGVGRGGALLDDGLVFGLRGDDVAGGIDDLGELGFGVGFDGVAEVGEDAGGENVEGDLGNVAVGGVAGGWGGAAGARSVFSDLGEEGLPGVEPV